MTNKEINKKVNEIIKVIEFLERELSVDISGEWYSNVHYDKRLLNNLKAIKIIIENNC